MATKKQVNFALMLMSRAGYSTRYMKAEHKALGATMRERRGTVEDWLGGKNVAEMSELIDRLKAAQPYRASDDHEVTELRETAGPDADIAELRKIAGLDKS